MNQDLRELTEHVHSHMREHSLVSPTIAHGTAIANVAVVARIVACLLMGNSELEIMDSLNDGFQEKTSKRYMASAKIWYEKIKRNHPEDFSEYLLDNAKNITPKKKKLPKPNNPLPSADTPSTHVNADGSVVEMKDVLKEEEKAI